MYICAYGKRTSGSGCQVGSKEENKKQAPDTVHITLYEDKTPLIIPEELLLCMENEDGLLEKFENYNHGQKKAFIDWIYSAKTEQTKANRIAKTITMIQKNEKI